MTRERKDLFFFSLWEEGSYKRDLQEILSIECSWCCERRIPEDSWQQVWSSHRIDGAAQLHNIWQCETDFSLHTGKHAHATWVDHWFHGLRHRWSLIRQITSITLRGKSISRGTYWVESSRRSRHSRHPVSRYNHDVGGTSWIGTVRTTLGCVNEKSSREISIIYSLWQLPPIK